MRRLVVLGMLAGGCGFPVGAGPDADPMGDDAPPDDGPPGDDGDIDTPGPTCLDKWRSHTVRFSPPVALAGVNSSAFERDPWVNVTETQLFLSSARPGSQGGADIYRYTRNSLADEWGNEQKFISFSTNASDSKISMNEAETIAIVSSSMGPNADLSVSTRDMIGGTWSGLSKMNLASVNTPAHHDYDPFLSADGLHLYWAPAPTGNGPQEIAVASRATVTSTFSAGVRITELNAGTGEGDPAVSRDESIILFYSTRTTGAVGGSDLWYGTRTGSTGPFSYVGIVPDVNTALGEGDPHLSADGCRLYFARNEVGTSWDLYVATVL